MKKFIEYNRNPKDELQDDIMNPSIDPSLIHRPHNISMLESFSKNYVAFNDNISKVDTLIEQFAKLSETTEGLVKREELESLFISHLILVNENIHQIKSDLSGINATDLAEIKSYIDVVDEKTSDLIEHISFELPKTKKSIIENDLTLNKKISELKGNILDLTDSLNESNGNIDIKINNIDNRIDYVHSIIKEESSNRKKITGKLSRLYEDVVSINSNIESLSEKYNGFTPIIDKINKFESDLNSVSFEYSENLQKTKKEISTIINEVNSIFINDKYIELDRKVEKIEEIFDKLSEKILINENDAPELKPASKQYSDEELAKLDRGASFQQPNPELVEANFKAVQTKMRFLEQAIGRIAATGPGGGEVNLRWLDDIDRSTIADGLFLRYNESNKKFDFASAGSIQIQSDWNQTNNTSSDYIKNKPTLPAGTIVGTTDTQTLSNKTFTNLVVTDTTRAGSGSLAGTLCDLSQTWNTTGNPTALRLNVTNTASGSTSKLIDLQVGGVSKFNIDKNGAPSILTNTNFNFGTSNIIDSGGSFFVSSAGSLFLRTNGSTNVLALTYPDVTLTATGSYTWGSSGTSSPDLKLYRDAANTLAQRNGTNSQILRVYNTYTDASNYERGVFDWSTTANTLTIGTEALGTGSKRALSINTTTSIVGTTASDLPTYGSEFLSIPANFTLGAAWAGDNTAGFVHTSGAGNTATLTYSTLAVITTKYQIVYTVTGRSTGSFTIAFGGYTASGIASSGAVGPTATATTSLTITPTFDFDGNIKLSIKAIIAGSSALVSFKDSASTIRNEIRANTGTGNTLIGINSGAFNTTGFSNTAIGWNSLANNTSGNYNNAMGYLALQLNTIGINNSAMGYQALQLNTTGNNNSAFGYQALKSNTTADSNSAFGADSLYSNTTGTNNVAIGGLSLASNITGVGNSAVGYQSLNNNNTGSYNSTVGYLSLYNSITGSGNSAIGKDAGRFIANGSTALTNPNNSTFLGYLTKASADNITNETVIGYNAIGSGSNTTTVGSSATLATKLFGVVSTGQVATTLASASTIAPTLPIHFVSGTAAIDTITPPTSITSTGGSITLIPTGIFTTTTAGNIAVALTASINKQLILTYDATTAKWYPSSIDVATGVPIVSSTASTASLTVSVGTIGSSIQYNITALAVGLTVNAPSGTPTDGQKLTLRIKDNGTSQTLSWDVIFRAFDSAIPIATSVSKTSYIGCIYNSAEATWDVVSVSTQI
jgi:hypothetical protein